MGRCNFFRVDVNFQTAIDRIPLHISFILISINIKVLLILCTKFKPYISCHSGENGDFNSIAIFSNGGHLDRILDQTKFYYSETLYSRTSIVRNASDFQLFFELSEFRTYRVGLFRIVRKIRAYKITVCQRECVKLLCMEYLPVLRSVKENENK